ncbi:MAG: tetratricopeptide repeat protein [Myxococcales bacterium]
MGLLLRTRAADGRPGRHRLCVLASRSAPLSSWEAPITAFAAPLVGPAVGNADLLVAEATRLYNEKAYEQARDQFLKATRVAPTTLGTYLSLARSYSATKDLERAVLTYRVYVKNAPESPDREKAQHELELVEKQLSATGVAPQLSANYVSLKASYFEALDKGNLSGPGSAGELLASIVGAGYAAPDLGDMATKLAKAVEAAADQTWQAVLAHKKVEGADLRKAGAFYALALEVGAAPAKQAARASFLEGLALLQESKVQQAETAFEDAAKKDASDTEAKFYRAFAKFTAGDKAGAIRLLEAELPNDVRTSVLKTAVAVEGPAAAAELEKFLFAKRWKNAP